MSNLKQVILKCQHRLNVDSVIGVFWRESNIWKNYIFESDNDGNFFESDESILNSIAKYDKKAVVLHGSEYIGVSNDDKLTRYIVSDIVYYYHENNKEKLHNILTFIEISNTVKRFKELKKAINNIDVTETEKEHDNMENTKQQQSMTKNDVIRIMEKELQELSECNTPIDGEKSYRQSEVMLEIARFLAEVKEAWK